MKVNINEMTDSERIVLTKEQLLDYMESCDVNVEGSILQGMHASLDCPYFIEVEEVLGNERT